MLEMGQRVVVLETADNFVGMSGTVTKVGYDLDDDFCEVTFTIRTFDGRSFEPYVALMMVSDLEVQSGQAQKRSI